MEGNFPIGNELGCRVRGPRAMTAAAALVREEPGRRARAGGEAASGLRRFVKENSLSLVAIAIFLACTVGLGLTGVREYNDEQRQHGEATVSLLQYLATPHFAEAIFENWESEFLQMGAFVLLTIMLRQKGAPDSKKLDEQEAEDEDPRTQRGKKDAPWPVRVGGLPLALYSHSLSIALMLLFALSFAGHAIGGAREYSAEQAAHGAPGVSALAYVGTARFWFESLQNWQSEFLAVGALFLLSIFLREKGSPQSKPVAAPHGETGRE